MRWRRSEDRLIFGMEGMTEGLENKKPTKREVVGMAARVFDPMGVMSPATVLWKMFFQTLCKAGVNWDEQLEGEHLREWNRLRAAMEGKVELSLQRWYGAEENQRARLVGFCDASEKAYAAVVYLRRGETEARVHFLAAKTRVAPTKELTIPRLELMSALLLAKLCQTVEEALKGVLELGETVCFTDSRVSLSWIGGVDREWKQFVENRVVAIRQRVPAQQWKHCPGADNSPQGECCLRSWPRTPSGCKDRNG